MGFGKRLFLAVWTRLAGEMDTLVHVEQMATFVNPHDGQSAALLAKMVRHHQEALGRVKRQMHRIQATTGVALQEP